jgi:hypothetical protein
MTDMTEVLAEKAREALASASITSQFILVEGGLSI